MKAFISSTLTDKFVAALFGLLSPIFVAHRRVNPLASPSSSRLDWTQNPPRKTATNLSVKVLAAKLANAMTINAGVSCPTSFLTPGAARPARRPSMGTSAEQH